MVISHKTAKEIAGLVLAAFGAILMGGQHIEGAIGRTAKSLEALAARLIAWPQVGSGFEFAPRWRWPKFFLFNCLTATAALYALASYEMREHSLNRWRTFSFLAALFIGSLGSLSFIWISSGGDLPPSSKSGNRNRFLRTIVRTSLVAGLPFAPIVYVLLALETMAFGLAFVLVVLFVLAICRVVAAALIAIRRTGQMFGYQSLLQQLGLAIFIVGTAIALWGVLDPGPMPVPPKSLTQQGI